MDKHVVEAAIRRAIERGAAPARPNPFLLGTDMELVRTETDVEIEPPVFEDYLADRRSDLQMSRFDSAFVTVPTGFGTSTSLQSVGRLLLARAIVSGDVIGTVEAFRSYVETNAAPVIAVMTVLGVKTAREVRLGADIRLLPLTWVPPSWERWQALGHTLVPAPDFQGPNIIRRIIRACD
jgi:hypothetical protein